MKIKHSHKKFGILFHHFHRKNLFYNSPGSLTQDKFYEFVSKNKDRIIEPNQFFESLRNKSNFSCLTFDDGLKCQYDLVLPVLKKFNIKALFFVPTSNFEKKNISVEIIRYFKHKYFKSTKEFYTVFLDMFKKYNKNSSNLPKRYSHLIRKFEIESPYYSDLDIKHKIIRDHILTDREYKNIIFFFIQKKKINLKKLTKALLMSKKDIIKISKIGHEIGLHSHTHSYKFHQLSYNQEYNEYKTNKIFLEKLIKKKINVASYPFGYQTKNSYKILKSLGIQYAFNKNFINKSYGLNKKNYNISRENISNIIKK